MNIWYDNKAWPATQQVLCATTTGLAVFTIETWTLAKKADLYESMIRPRHDRYVIPLPIPLLNWMRICCVN
jgi:hypothetical protein